MEISEVRDDARGVREGIPFFIKFSYSIDKLRRNDYDRRWFIVQFEQEVISDRRFRYSKRHG